MLPGLQENLAFVQSLVLKFYRIQLKNGEVVYSKQYLRARRTDNCTVFLQCNKFGSVNYFLEITHGSTVVLLASVNVFNSTNTVISGVQMPHLPTLSLRR